LNDVCHASWALQKAGSIFFQTEKEVSYYYDEIVWLLQKQFHKPEPLLEKLQLKLLLRPEKKRKRSIRQNENGKQWLQEEILGWTRLRDLEELRTPVGVIFQELIQTIEFEL
jgi:hypothetical protein